MAFFAAFISRFWKQNKRNFRPKLSGSWQLLLGLGSPVRKEQDGSIVNRKSGPTAQVCFIFSFLNTYLCTSSNKIAGEVGTNTDFITVACWGVRWPVLENVLPLFPIYLIPRSQMICCCLQRATSAFWTVWPVFQWCVFNTWERALWWSIQIFHVFRRSPAERFQNTKNTFHFSCFSRCNRPEGIAVDPDLHYSLFLGHWIFRTMNWTGFLRTTFQARKHTNKDANRLIARWPPQKELLLCVISQRC